MTAPLTLAEPVRWHERGCMLLGEWRGQALTVCPTADETGFVVRDEFSDGTIGIVDSYDNAKRLAQKHVDRRAIFGLSAGTLTALQDALIHYAEGCPQVYSDALAVVTQRLAEVRQRHQ